MKAIAVPDHLKAEATQNISIALLSRPHRSGKPFEGLHLGGGLYAVARFVTHVKLFEGTYLASEGVAVCSPQDEFDSELGLRIALGRALKSYEEEYFGAEPELFGGYKESLYG